VLARTINELHVQDLTKNAIYLDPVLKCPIGTGSEVYQYYLGVCFCGHCISYTCFHLRFTIKFD